MRLTAHILKSFEKETREEIHVLSQQTLKSVKAAGKGLKGDLAAHIKHAGLGSRLSHTWRLKVFKNDSFNAAALITSRAPHIIESFDQGAVIRSIHGKWLAIPTSAAPKKGVDGRRITPLTFPEKRYGRLRFLKRPQGHAVLVVDQATISKGGRIKPLSSRGKGKALAMFVLLPQVRLIKRLDIARVALHWQNQLASFLGKNRPL